MNTSDIESVLVDYARSHLSPTEVEQADISRKYEQLKDFLKGRVFQNGSYARHTSTTPVNDLDVIYELPEAVRESMKAAAATIDFSKLDIHNIVATLAKELQDFYGTSAIIKPQPHSVGVYFGSEDDFSIDVVPALPADNNMYWVPETAHLSVVRRRQAYAKKSVRPSPNWIKSDPKGYATQAADVDDSSGGRFRKTAKMIKKWRWRWKEANEDFPLKSFHIELAVTKLFKENPGITCLDAIRRFINILPDLIVKPQFADKADNSRFIDAYVSELKEYHKGLVTSAQNTSSTELVSLINAVTKEKAEAILEQFLGIQAKRNISSKIGGVFADAFDAARKTVLKGLRPLSGREAEEQFLSDFGIGTNIRYSVKINATVTQDGFRPFRLLGTRHPLKKYRRLEFIVESCSVPKPYEIKWKVKNTGAEALRLGQLRGQIHDDDGYGKRKESTKYWGNHYVECFVIKDNVCVAADHLDVDIGKE